MYCYECKHFFYDYTPASTLEPENLDCGCNIKITTLNKEADIIIEKIMEDENLKANNCPFYFAGLCDQCGNLIKKGECIVVTNIYENEKVCSKKCEKEYNEEVEKEIEAMKNGY